MYTSGDGTRSIAVVEWCELTTLLGLPSDVTYDLLRNHVRDLTAESVGPRWLGEPIDVPALVRAFIDAGLGGSDVPPTDLIGKVRRIGELRAQAHHTTRALAGEVADLINRVEHDIPDLLAEILAHLIDATGLPRDVDAILDLVDHAYGIVTGLLDRYELRDRDETRPVDVTIQPAENDPTCACGQGNRHSTMLDNEFTALHPTPVPDSFTRLPDPSPTGDTGSDFPPTACGPVGPRDLEDAIHGSGVTPGVRRVAPLLAVHPGLVEADPEPPL